MTDKHLTHELIGRLTLDTIRVAKQELLKKLIAEVDLVQFDWMEMEPHLIREWLNNHLQEISK